MIFFLTLFIATAAGSFLHHVKYMRLTNRPKLIFDLDDTLYPHSSGFYVSLISAIDAYTQTSLNCDAKSVREVSYQLYRQYGMTTKGLMLEYNVDLADYETFIDGRMNYSLIKHDPKLVELLQSAKADVIVFTNSGLMHATRALEILGALPHVHMVIYSDYTDPGLVVKPYQEAYERVEALLQTDPSSIYFFDDSKENVRTAKERGWNAVQIFESQEDAVVPCDNDIQTIENVHATFSVFPSLFSE